MLESQKPTSVKLKGRESVIDKIVERINKKSKIKTNRHSLILRYIDAGIEKDIKTK